MRTSIKGYLAGFLMAGALGFGAVGVAHAMGANDADAFIGIVGGSPQENQCQGCGGGYPSRGYPNDYQYVHRRYGAPYNGGYNRGY